MAKGSLKYFSGPGKISSVKVYKVYPSEEIIEEFKRLCAADDAKMNFNDLVYDSISITILELSVVFA